MYNSHRGMVAAPNNRLTELLDQVRAEFENQAGRAAGEYEQQSTFASHGSARLRHYWADSEEFARPMIQALNVSNANLSYDAVANQMQEMEMVRSKVYHLEQGQIAIKQKYDEEITRLHREIEARGGASQPSHLGAQQHGGPSQPPPPSIGHGPSNLFGGIMAGQGGQGAPGLAPPPQEQSQPHASHQMPQPPPGLQQQQGPPQAQQPFSGYPAPGALNGYGSQPPPPTASPGLGKGRNNRGIPGPATPQQNQQVSYPDPRASPHVTRPTPPPPPPPPSQLQQQQQPPPPPPQQQQQQKFMNVGNTLADLDLERLPASQKKEGVDWFAVFNPMLQRTLDVDLVHTLPHDSVVCCVRFSHDGKFVATGCNRAAQIFDVRTGKAVCLLQDETVDKSGDLYIRSVCFSPDGQYLATGAEDKQIRVWDIVNRTIKYTFIGHEQDIYSLDYARDGRHIASGSGDRSVRLWSIETGSQTLELRIEDGVTTVAISPDCRYVAAGSLDKSVRVWDASTGYLVERLEGQEGHKDSVYSVAFAPNGRDLVSGSLDKTIKMWEFKPRGMLVGSAPKGGKCLRTFEGHKDFVLSVAETPDGAWVLSGSKDRGVQFWDPNTGDTQLMLQGHKNSGRNTGRGNIRVLLSVSHAHG
ncbi:MAG: general transcription repressor [Candelina submexicana]|nr:MAG: general transcription repressor [Candelina submexicana]